MYYDWLLLGYIKVRHTNSQTIFTIKGLIFFKYLCSYSLTLIQPTYIFTNIVEAAKPNAQD